MQIGMPIICRISGGKIRFGFIAAEEDPNVNPVAPVFAWADYNNGTIVWNSTRGMTRDDDLSADGSWKPISATVILEP